MTAKVLTVIALFGASLCLAVRADERPEQRKFDRLHRSSSATGEAEITQDRLREHVVWLASDENEGRKTAKGKLEGRVADYIEAELTLLGLKPAGNAEGTSFRQPFYARSWMEESVHGHEDLDFRDPANFGHLPNSLGVAIDAAGKPATVDPLDEEHQRILDEGGQTAEPNTFNIIALMEGTDPALASQIVVIGAHMDHIGTSRWGGGDTIYNGADDNGSGTSSLLTMARALARDKQHGNGPARSVLFCFFSGEELGLLGSQFYATNPTVEWSRLQSMINVDMIGRAQRSVVSVYDGLSSNQPNHFHDLHDTSGTGLAEIQHNLRSFLNRSDQYPFYRKGLPVSFFFEGFETTGQMNDDYHGRGDHADKLDVEKMRDITVFVYRHLLGAANLAPARR